MLLKMELVHRTQFRQRAPPPSRGKKGRRSWSVSSRGWRKCGSCWVCALWSKLPDNHSRRTPGSSDSDPLLTTQTRDLLRQIAEKERRCFELRDELAAEESALVQLRATFQRMATKDLAYSTSPTLHRRTTSTSSSASRPSLSNDATEAWNTISSKIPGSLKNQFNNLLESMTIADPTPEPIEKDSPVMHKAKLTEAGGGGDESAMLRPGTLTVLEEEGSDVGSAALSPRSPLSPAVTNLHLTPTSRDRDRQALDQHHHSQLASLSHRLPPQSESDSNVLGFSVDENGIATPPPPLAAAAKTNLNSSSSWTSRRTSVLGSLSSLSKQVEISDSLGGGFASMFAKRLKEAREGASEMLRDAERKLGNAMTIDEFLGVEAEQQQQQQQPRIKLDKPEQDHEREKAEENGWEKAAGGRRSSSSAKSSPNLVAVDGRGSNSSRSSLNLPPSAATGGGGGLGVKHANGSKSSLDDKDKDKDRRDSWSWN